MFAQVNHRNGVGLALHNAVTRRWRRARRDWVLTVGDVSRLANNGLTPPPVSNWAHENLVSGRAWRSPFTALASSVRFALMAHHLLVPQMNCPVNTS